MIGDELLPGLSSRNEFFALAAKNYAEADIRVFRSFQITSNFLLFAKYFVTMSSFATRSSWLRLSHTFDKSASKAPKNVLILWTDLFIFLVMLKNIFGHVNLYENHNNDLIKFFQKNKKTKLTKKNKIKYLKNKNASFNNLLINTAK